MIINSMQTDERSVIYGNVPNTGLIGNLPDGCCVEVPCLVDGNGVQPTVIGDLPPQLSTLLEI
jgi:alpha-galactosidase